MTITDDYTESDRWDWDQSDESQHCEHGTFIGSWWGPDILCHWCEAGISADEAEQIEMQHLLREATDKIDRMNKFIRQACDLLGIARGIQLAMDICDDDPECQRAYDLTNH